MSIRLLDWRLRGAVVEARIPFRFGIAEMNELVHAVLFVTVEVDGTREIGVAADNLAPKWFTKNPETTYAEDVREMIGVIESACSIAERSGAHESVFDLWQRVHEEQRPRGDSRLSPLLAAFGVSFVERALIDAHCRARGLPFAEAVRANTLGIRLETLHTELAGCEPRELLPARPLTRIAVRHTVGLGDALAEGEDAVGARRRPAGDPRGLRRALRPALLQGQGRRQPPRRSRPARSGRRRAGSRHGRRLSGHARRERAVRGHAGAARLLGGAGGRFRHRRASPVASSTSSSPFPGTWP